MMMMFPIAAINLLQIMRLNLSIPPPPLILITSAADIRYAVNNTTPVDVGSKAEMMGGGRAKEAGSTMILEVNMSDRAGVRSLLPGESSRSLGSVATVVCRLFLFVLVVVVVVVMVDCRVDSSSLEKMERKGWKRLLASESERREYTSLSPAGIGGDGMINFSFGSMLR